MTDSIRYSKRMSSLASKNFEVLLSKTAVKQLQALEEKLSKTLVEASQIILDK